MTDQERDIWDQAAEVDREPVAGLGERPEPDEKDDDDDAGGGK